MKAFEPMTLRYQFALKRFSKPRGKCAFLSKSGLLYQIKWLAIKTALQKARSIAKDLVLNRMASLDFRVISCKQLLRGSASPMNLRAGIRRFEVLLHYHRRFGSPWKISDLSRLQVEIVHVYSAIANLLARYLHVHAHLLATQDMFH